MTHSDSLLNRAMLLLAEQGALFIGQGVRYDCHAMYRSLEGVPDAQRIELPVIEEMQMGMGIGLSLMGNLVCSIYPRFDFLLRAMDQLVNHLDKLEAMSCGQYRPKVIIRTTVGKKHPLNAGPQHTQDHTDAMRLMLRHVEVKRIIVPESILPTYEYALERDGSTLIVEALS